MKLNNKDFLTLLDYTPEEIIYLLDLSKEFKDLKKRGIPPKYVAKSIDFGVKEPAKCS